jgi:hypothetical protein
VIELPSTGFVYRTDLERWLVSSARTTCRKVGEIGFQVASGAKTWITNKPSCGDLLRPEHAWYACEACGLPDAQRKPPDLVPLAGVELTWVGKSASTVSVGGFGAFRDRRFFLLRCDTLFRSGTMFFILKKPRSQPRSGLDTQRQIKGSENEECDNQPY